MHVGSSPTLGTKGLVMSPSMKTLGQYEYKGEYIDAFRKYCKIYGLSIKYRNRSGKQYVTICNIPEDEPINYPTIPWNQSIKYGSGRDRWVNHLVYSHFEFARCTSGGIIDKTYRINPEDYWA